MARISRALLKQVMTQLGRNGGKAAAKNMTPAERRARAKKASLAAAKKRTAAARKRAR